MGQVPDSPYDHVLYFCACAHRGFTTSPTQNYLKVSRFFLFLNFRFTAGTIVDEATYIVCVEYPGASNTKDVEYPGLDLGDARQSVLRLQPCRRPRDISSNIG